MTINKEAVHIHPQALFQRLTLVAAKENLNVQDLFKYELCSYPTSMFDSTGSPRPAGKAILGSALWSQLRYQECKLPTGGLFVLDGGALLHRIIWHHGLTFKEICHVYIKYVLCKYGKCVIVFDGYSEQHSVKDMTHLRRGVNIYTVN